MNANVIAKKLESIERKGAMRSVDVANLLGTRPETVSRWNLGKAFPRSDAERTLLDLEYLVDLLSDIYQPDAPQSRSAHSFNTRWAMVTRRRVG